MSRTLAALLGALALASPGSARQLATREPEAFPVFVWCQDHAGGALPAALATAFGGVNVEGDDPAEWVRGAGLDFYVGHAPGRNALHIDDATEWYSELWEAYWSERDASLLVREPCLSRAATLEALEERLARSLAARDGDTGRGLSLGDEVGLTRFGGPLDLCVSRECRAAFARFLATSPRWRGLSPAEGEALPYPDTDETRRAWIDGDPRHVAAWMARREFHHALFLEVLARLAARAHALAPGAPVGLVGLAGRTAHGGVAVEALLPHVDFIEAYATLDTRELLYTLRGPRQQSWLTVFNEGGRPASAAWQVREHWLRGGDALVLWSDRALLADADYLAATRAAVAEVRSLEERLPDWRPVPAGLAVVHDPEALALGWLRDALHDGPTWPKRFASYQNEHGTREVRLRAWLRLAEDAGLLPGALPFEAVGAETLERFPLLVLNQQIVLEESELQRLAAFVEAGGRLLISGRFDVWDLAGAASELGAFARLRELGGERVQRFELDGARYLAERCCEPRAFVTRLVRELGAQLATAGVATPDWSPRSATRAYPWLRAEVAGARPGERLCAAIPGLQLAAERRLLEAVDVRLEGVEDYQVEWLAPRPPAADGRVRLEAGELLVFRLRPR